MRKLLIIVTAIVFIFVGLNYCSGTTKLSIVPISFDNTSNKDEYLIKVIDVTKYDTIYKVKFTMSPKTDTGMRRFIKMSGDKSVTKLNGELFFGYEIKYYQFISIIMLDENDNIIKTETLDYDVRNYKRIQNNSIIDEIRKEVYKY